MYRRADAAVPLTLETRALYADIAPESDDLDISAIVKRYSSSRPRGTGQTFDEVTTLNG
jgi:hypothetical protein